MKVVIMVFLWLFVLTSLQAQEDVEDRFTFESFDVNGDGVISPAEAIEVAGLVEEWIKGDKDGDSVIDPVEFSVFASKGRFVPPDEDELPALGSAPFSTADVSN